MARKKAASKKVARLKNTLYFELIGFVILAFSIVGIADLGLVGKVITLFCKFFLGEWYILLLFYAVFTAIFFMVKRTYPQIFTVRMIGLFFMIASILVYSHNSLVDSLTNGGNIKNPSVIKNTFELYVNAVSGKPVPTGLGGGMIGAFLYAFLYLFFEQLGAKLFAFLFFLIGFILFTGKSISEQVIPIVLNVFEFLKKQIGLTVIELKKLRNSAKSEKQEKPKRKRNEESNEDEITTVEIEDAAPIIEIVQREIPRDIEMEDSNNLLETIHNKNNEESKEDIYEDVEIIPSNEENGNIISEIESLPYKVPPIDLLKKPKQKRKDINQDYVYANSSKLEKTFESFGVKAKVKKVHLGPAVTKYEVYPDAGVKVSKIVSLSDDLALALAAKDIRIEAPIPGKSAIGIEVPNEEVSMVMLREVLEGKEREKASNKLLVGLGRDITGDSVVAELNRMPHLLVAGATGSGKSVCINGIIVSILLRAKPNEVKLVMIDPKMVELNVYNGIPHLLMPVVTDPKKASQALKRIVSEMERRYELFSHTGTRNIEGYNDYIRKHNEEGDALQPEIPFMVVIVDELADLMLVASSDVEDSIMRLAQMARAAGIHLIIATQRPSVDVITGVIKANIPSRIAFSVSSQTDSRTILDTGGAEKLLGRGDMLYLPVGASKPIRVQGAFLSDEEVQNVVDYCIGQQKAQYNEEMMQQITAPKQAEEIEDEIFDDAVNLITEMQTASVSMLQRRFRIGYTRAARLIDMMENRGIVGPYEGSKPREVLIKSIEELTDKSS